MKSMLRSLFNRVARSLGILEVQTRLDSTILRLDSTIARLDSTRQTMREQSDITTVRLNELESNYASVLSVGALERHLERRMDQVYQQLQVQSDQSTRHTEAVVGEVHNYLLDLISTTRRDLDNLRRAASTSVGRGDAPVPTEHSSLPTIDPALYVSLEDHFRGDPELVAARQEEYLVFVREVVSAEYPLVDLGCGRGEWLGVLASHGVAARGIDSNPACVAECVERGLSAEQADLMTALSGLPDQSCGAITMFQVLEHLPFELIAEVLREIRRVLVDGGVFIGEIPNLETLRVGASTFWLDPTHLRPLHPSLLTFLAGKAGFRGLQGRYSSPVRPEPNLSQFDAEIRSVFLDWHYAINGPGDFALIATA